MTLTDQINLLSYEFKELVISGNLLNQPVSFEVFDEKKEEATLSNSLQWYLFWPLLIKNFLMGFF